MAARIKELIFLVKYLTIKKLDLSFLIANDNKSVVVES